MTKSADATGVDWIAIVYCAKDILKMNGDKYSIPVILGACHTIIETAASQGVSVEPIVELGQAGD